MKRNKLIVCFVVVIMAIASFFLANNSTQERVDNLSMSNIEALHASAAEAVCDTSTDKECTIKHNSGIVGKSYGNMYFKPK
jgi:flagellar basal body-associated protein FliL